MFERSQRNLGLAVNSAVAESLIENTEFEDTIVIWSLENDEIFLILSIDLHILADIWIKHNEFHLEITWKEGDPLTFNKFLKLNAVVDGILDTIDERVSGELWIRIEGYWEIWALFLVKDKLWFSTINLVMSNLREA